MRYRFRAVERKELKERVRSGARDLYFRLKAAGGKGGEAQDFRMWTELVKPLYLEPSSRVRAREALSEVFETGEWGGDSVCGERGARETDCRPGGGGIAVEDVLAGLFSIQCATAAVAFQVVEKIRGLRKNLQGAEKTLAGFLQGLPLEHAVSFIWRSAGRLDSEFERVDADDWRSDLLGSLFHDTVSKKLRHAFGAYHTASPVALGLCRIALAEMKQPGRSGRGGPGRMLDPGCGSGVFLVEAYREVRREWTSDDGLGSVWGFDMSPVAVVMSRLNLAASCEKPWSRKTIDHVCKGVRLNDSIMGRPLKGGGRGFDVLVGNPPWVRWDVLSSDYRNEIRTLVKHRANLFHERGFLASLGGSNDDLLTVFTALASERYLAEGGVLAFLVKQSVFTNRTGAAFRLLGENGPRSLPLGWRQIHDLRLLKGVFDAGDQQPGAVVAKLGSRPLNPLPLIVWERRGRDLEFREGTADVLEPGRVGSPWIVTKNADVAGESPGSVETSMERAAALCGGNGFRAGFVGENAYRDDIRHGLKHDAEGIYAVTILRKNGDKVVVRPKGASIEGDGGVEEYEVESAWVHPYIKPRHVRRWSIRGWEYVVVPQNRAGEENEDALWESAPGIWKYLDAHRDRLLQRKSRVYRKGPFYSVFGLGPYTWKHHRVVWSGLGNMPWFAYLKPVEDPFLGTRCAVVDTSCYTMTAMSEEEALYLVGVLNCPVVSIHLEACGSGAKRPLSKTALARLAIPRYEPGDQAARAVVDIARTLSEAGNESSSGKDLSERSVPFGGEVEWRASAEKLIMGS